jgi:hypothetical protein
MMSCITYFNFKESLMIAFLNYVLNPINVLFSYFLGMCNFG